MNTRIFPDWLIKDSKILNEDYREKDLLWWDNYIEQFAHELVMIPSGSLLWLIGRFWSGKSTFLNQLNHFLYKAKTYLFEAWKYPDRENLWINFVYEIAKNLWVEKTKEVLQRINGKDHNLPKAILSDLMNLGHLSAFKDFLYHRGQNQLDLVYEILKELLSELCPRMDWCAYLIIEDIDRSWDRGIYFIETLNYFLKKIIQEQREAREDIIKLKVIVPISDDNYESDKQSYLKSIDYFHAFSPKNSNFRKFVNFLFLDDIVNDRNFWTIFADFLYALYEKYPQTFTIRQIKAILRAANSAYGKIVNSQLYNSNGLDYRIFLITFFWKYLPDDADGFVKDHWYWAKDTYGLFPDTIRKILNQDIQNTFARDLFIFKDHEGSDREIQDVRNDISSSTVFVISSKYLNGCKMATWRVFFI